MAGWWQVVSRAVAGVAVDILRTRAFSKDAIDLKPLLISKRKSQGGVKQHRSHAEIIETTNIFTMYDMMLDSCDSHARIQPKSSG
jgi:hypothetical protein